MMPASYKRFSSLVEKVFRSLSGLAVKQSLFTARLIYAFAIVAYPVMGVVFNAIVVDANDPMEVRIVLAFILATIFFFSFKSECVKRSTTPLSFLLFYLMTFHTEYLVCQNNHKPEYIVGFIIILMSSGIILKNIKSLLLYSTTVLVWILIDDYHPDSTSIDRSIEIVLFFTALAVTAVVILVREDLSARLMLSDNIIERFKGIVLVFDQKDRLIFSNRETIEAMGLSPGNNQVYDPAFHAQLLKLEAGKSLESVETAGVKNKVWIEWNLSHTQQNHKVFVGHDITKLKVKEKELISMSFRIQNYASRVKALHRLDQAIITAENFEETTARVLKFIKESVPKSSIISLIAFKNEGPELSAVLEKNNPVKFIHEPIPQPHNNILQEEHYVIGDLRKKGDLTFIEQQLVDKGVVTLAVFCISMDNVPVAVINIGFSKLTELGNEQMKLLEEMTQGLGIFIRQVQLKNQLEETNDEIIEANGELRRVNDELRHFAYVTSHDLKAPLRAVNSLVQFIQEDHKEELGKEANKKLELLQDRVSRMDLLINGILEYSRVGRLVEEKREISLKDEIISILETLSPPQTIKIDISDSLPVIYSQPTRIHQIFLNLLGNAVKFVDPEIGKIEIGYLQNEDELTFFVKDNGLGIEDHFQDKIFTLFQTGGHEKNPQSTGIGLTIVKKNVEMLGGKVWVESKEGLHTVFYFTIPYLNRIDQSEPKMMTA